MEKTLDELQDRELDLSLGLRHILETAVSWVDARYGALGVIGEDRLLSQFITTGMDDAQVAAIGPLPKGHGLLGELIRHPASLRLADLSAHPSSCGFPPNHPPMRSFLGMPIRVRGEVFGNLYLTEKRGGGEFDAKDESLIWTLAVAAGNEIDNVRWHRQARKQTRGFAATTKVASALLADESEETVLRLVVEQAMEITDADLGLVAWPTGNLTTLSVDVAVGAGAGLYKGTALPLEGSWAGAALRSTGPIKTADIVKDTRVTAGPRTLAGLGPAMAVRLSSFDQQSTPGILMLARVAGRKTFDDDDLMPLLAFAKQATIGFRLAQRRVEAEQLKLMHDRDRIARDLHDLAIQRMIGTGMALQSVQRFVQPPEARERVINAVEDLEATAKIIRTTIFELQGQHLGLSKDGMRTRIVQAVAQGARALGFNPSLRMDGLLDSVVSAELEEHVTAALVEALSNVARHALASSVETTITATGNELILTVVDDGVGIPEGGRRSGLANLAERARSCGGEFTAVTGESGGTQLCWRAPLKQP